MSVIVDLADAILREMEAHAFGVPSQFRRAYRPEYTLGDIAEPVITIIPKESALQIGSRAGLWHDVSLDIVVQRKLELEGLEESDAMMALVQDIMVWLAVPKAPGYPAAIFVEIANTPIFDPEIMQTNRQFASLITVTYRVDMAAVV